MQVHQLEGIPDGQHCTVCKWRWRLYPTSLCPGVERFAYEQVPPSMKTYTQLRAQGLKPADRARPDGCYYVVHRRDWLWFYDERQAIPRRKATPAQLQALAKAREAFIARYTCLGCGKKPQTPHDIKDLVCGYCSACRWEAAQENLSAQIEMDGEAACAWAVGLLTTAALFPGEGNTRGKYPAVFRLLQIHLERGSNLLHALCRDMFTHANVFTVILLMNPSLSIPTPIGAPIVAPPRAKAA